MSKDSDLVNQLLEKLERTVDEQADEIEALKEKIRILQGLLATKENYIAYREEMYARKDD